MKPTARRSLRTWVSSVRRVLVLRGFIEPRTKRRASSAHDRLVAVLGLAIGAVVFVVTSVAPTAGMIAMAWGCEHHSRRLGRRGIVFYGGEAASAEAAIAIAAARRDRGHNRRQGVRAVLLALSVVLPLAFVDYVAHTKGGGVLWGLGALVACQW